MHRTLTLVAILALAFGACGDDDDDVTDGARDTTRTTGTGTEQCAPVAFTPASEDAATDITATGLSCADAEALVRAAGSRTDATGPDELTVEGYRCVLTRSEQDPLPRAFFECTDGPRKVTFVRT